MAAFLSTFAFDTRNLSSMPVSFFCGGEYTQNTALKRLQIYWQFFKHSAHYTICETCFEAKIGILIDDTHDLKIHCWIHCKTQWGTGGRANLAGEQLQQIEHSGHSAIPSSKHLNLTRVTVYVSISNTFSHQKFRNSWNSIPFLNVSHCASCQLHVFHFCPKWAYGTRIGNLGGISNKISMVFPAFLFPVPHCVSSKIHARRYDKCHHNLTRKKTLFFSVRWSHGM